MPEWLDDLVPSAAELPLDRVATRLAIAALTGLVVAAVHQRSQRKPAGEAFPFLVTLVLLTILVAMTTLVIGNNVARAFSLVGALAIVRFRTIVEDTRDTAFVIFAVVAGMAIGAGHYRICLVGVPIVAAVSLAMSAWGRRARGAAALATSAEQRLLVRVGLGHEPESLLRAACERHLDSHRLTTTATSRQGAALDLEYRVRLRDPARAVALVQELSRLDGVQHVELAAG